MALQRRPIVNKRLIRHLYVANVPRIGQFGGARRPSLGGPGCCPVAPGRSKTPLTPTGASEQIPLTNAPQSSTSGGLAPAVLRSGLSFPLMV